MQLTDRQILVVPRQGYRRHSAGVVLFASLIVLIIVTLAVLSTIRRVDSSNMLAGSLAFRQAALAATEQGFDRAYRVLMGSAAASLQNNGTGNGYRASATNTDVNWRSEDTWANASTRVTDSGGNQQQFLIERLCSASGDPAANLAIQCARAGAGVAPSSLMEHTQEAFVPPVTAPIIYRITVRVLGPRNVTSIAQAFVTN
ncbi:hypothetical protein ABWL39_16140 [Chitinivorax sp. PXF-14]|uniref:pilus assembly PilX family protein n=1 Tax=Chitinivorax sp. PXF-14 TaxID=3230488 RepID=UPI0034653098